MSFLKEFIEFLMIRKKYWLLPIVIVLVLFGGLIILSQGSAIAPFINYYQKKELECLKKNIRFYLKQKNLRI